MLIREKEGRFIDELTYDCCSIFYKVVNPYKDNLYMYIYIHNSNTYRKLSNDAFFVCSQTNQTFETSYHGRLK